MFTDTWHDQTSDSIIEGINNSVLYVFISVFSLLFAFILWVRRSGSQIIHPSHHEQVQALRERILSNRPESSQPSTNQQQQRNRNHHREERCPICIDHFSFAVETNCGHVFCCSCVMSYYEHGNWVAAMDCPICRQKVSVLLPDFSHEDEVSDEFETHIEQVRTYNRRYSGDPRTVWEVIADFPVLARHMFRNFFSVSGLVAMLRFRIVLYLFLVIMYVLSPLDIIPESVVGLFGFLDDLAIAAVILVYLTVLFRQSMAGH